MPLPLFPNDQKGAVAVEAALILPMLILLLVGIVDLSTVLMLKSKLAAGAETGADLIAREICVTDSQVTDAFTAISLILTPYADLTATYDLASVQFDAASGAPSVAWRSTKGASSATATTLAAAATGLGSPGDSVIVSRVSYSWQPLFALVFTGPVSLGELAFLRPRQSRAVAKNGC